MVEPKDLLRYALEATRDRVIRCLEDLSEEEARRVVQGLSPVVWQVGHLAQADGVLLRRAGAPPSRRRTRPSSDRAREGRRTTRP
jgi:hypothetical protein